MRSIWLPRWCGGIEYRRFRRYLFDLWVRKIPRGGKWQPTPVFLPGKFHGQRSLAGYSPWDYKDSTQLSDFHFVLLYSVWIFFSFPKFSLEHQDLTWASWQPLAEWSCKVGPSLSHPNWNKDTGLRAQRWKHLLICRGRRRQVGHDVSSWACVHARGLLITVV